MIPIPLDDQLNAAIQTCLDCILIVISDPYTTDTIAQMEYYHNAVNQLDFMRINNLGAHELFNFPIAHELLEIQEFVYDTVSELKSNNKIEKMEE